MQSVNFEFLRHVDADLASLAGFAESYAQTDPASAAVKLRLFAERMVAHIYRQQKLAPPFKDSLLDFLKGTEFVQLVPQPVLNIFHAIRRVGNHGAHGNPINSGTVLPLIGNTHQLAIWWYVSFHSGDRQSLPVYTTPERGGAVAGIKAKLKQEKKEALEALARQAEELTTLKQQLELAHQALDQSQHLAALQTATDKSKAAASTLSFNELETRLQLIDTELTAAGWDVGAHPTSTDQVGQEVEVAGQPTKTGLGYADYVLWDDSGKPLAVIEAKRTIEDAEKGRTQAKLYADGLEKKHGQRPIIFYSNGYDIWIWDDASNYPPRPLFGFYSKDSLQLLIFQRAARKPLADLNPKKEIVERLYQVETIKRVTEKFETRKRKALIVQATGTGKTRVAIALSELLIRAGWAKRILFLCDRRELRKQAKNAYSDFLDEPITTVSSRTPNDRNQRIYVGTYPAMLKIYRRFDVGFFDLIIADESHRSIYNVYGDLFQYFDALQVGLTATPVDFVTRNTFELFECEALNPTANYDYDRAVSEGYLVPFEVETFTTDFLRRGIKHSQLDEEQIQALIDKGEDPETFQYEAREVDANVYNKDTGRHVLRNLMENGIRDAEGQQIGKTILFARGHDHAVLLQRTFDEMYPQFGGKFCRVIDNYDPRAEQLIDDFKSPANELTLAISVDMLDTGIDVPEVVNLVFAKPVFSKVKFWQMIGRGTRLCPNLFGAGQDKRAFRIFDHWGNFDFFEFHYQKVEPKQGKALTEQLFETRIELAEAALQAQDDAVFRAALRLIEADIRDLPQQSIAVREEWRSVQGLLHAAVLPAWAPGTVQTLRQRIAPLMRWRSIRGHSEAHDFDLLITRSQLAALRKAAALADCKIKVIERVSALRINLTPVQDKLPLIQKVKGDAFWNAVTASELEQAREALRGIIHHRHKSTGPGPDDIREIDTPEDESKIERSARQSSIPNNEMKLYEQKVEAALKALFEHNSVLQKIRRLEPVTAEELAQLTSLVLTQHALDLALLKEFYAEAASLDDILRGLVGLDATTVKKQVEDFVHAHPGLNPRQIRFLSLLQNHIVRFGIITVERLYEAPFTTVSAEGVDDLFADKTDDLLRFVRAFLPAPKREEPSGKPN
ncbi:MAG: DEAD/DEAH box helicase family protein [Panacagrimonas sp.]